MTWQLILSIFFLLLNVFFVLAEFSSMRAQAAKLEVMHNRGKTRAGLVLHMMRRLDRYLSAIQIGVTMSTIGLGWSGEPAIARLIAAHISWPALFAPYTSIFNTIVAFCLIIYSQIVFAELLPRYMAIRRAEMLAIWIAFPLEIYYRIFRLPTWILSKSSVLIAKGLGISPTDEHETAFSEEEMRVLMGTAQEKGLLPLDRLLIIENLFDLGTLRVRDAMVPREKIVFLSTGKTWEENREILKVHHFTRYPVGNPDLDQVAGFVHVKDLILHEKVDLLSLRRPISKVQDSEKLQPLLKMMTAQGKPMVLCMRGSDRITGLLTLEDILEEIVGEIYDEFDAPKAWSFYQYLAAETINLSMPAGTSNFAIHLLTDLIRSVEPTLNMAAVEKAVTEREQQLPTAIGKGVAVPHARLASLKVPRIAIGRTSKSFSFPTPDKVPVKLVFLILTPTSQPLEQLRILSRVAMLVNNETVHRRILKAKTPGDLLDIIRTSEALISG